MQLSYTHLLIAWFMCLVFYGPALAQAPSQSNQPSCGTPNLTPVEAKSLVQEANQVLQRKRSSNAAFTAITYVPIRPHIIRRSDGTGGYPLASINKVIALTNRYYLLNGFGIQFYFAGATPGYVDDTGLYTTYPYEERATVDNYDAHDALNQYYVVNIEGGKTGYAYYPADYLRSTHSIIQTYAQTGNDDYLGNYTIPHELGHNFNLFHTFGTSNGESVTNELVTRGPGANCETAGDFICDTPADPWGMPGINFFYVGDHCLQYDPNSTARDPNGDAYTPPVGNIMAYYNTCTHYFTPGQYDRIQAGLALRQSHTSYSLSAPATNVSPPTNLNLSFDGSSIVLTWQDNANNEMGYFIERSTSPTSDFLPIGGVASDVTIFTDTQIVLNTQYYYRIRPSNTTLGNLSVTVSVTTNPCLTPSYPGSTPARTSASLFWGGAADQTYNLRERPVGDPHWTTINNIPGGLYSTTYSLTGLTSNTAYEWQVQGVCSTTSTSEFSSTQSFTTLTCPTPYNGSTSFVLSSSAGLVWYTSYTEPGRTFDIRYRPVGSTDWITTGGITSQTYSLTGLANSTTYEWQVRSVCSSTEISGYSPGSTFTTICRVPNGQSSAATATTAKLSWTPYFISETGTTYQFQYRLAGSANWTTVSGITGFSYLLTGLATNTTYEWHVQTICSGNVLSGYSNTATFTTGCNAPFTYNLTTSLLTSSLAQLNWFVLADAGTHFDIRYRPLDTANWFTISNLTATTTNGINTNGVYNLTNLANSTPYEWQIKTVCSPTESSGFTNSITFQTLTPCLDTYTVKAGLWNDPTVWSCNRVPTNGDRVQIKHLVTIPASYVANAQQVGFDIGMTISYGTSAQLKLGF